MLFTWLLAFSWPVLGPDGPTEQTVSEDTFALAPFPAGPIVTELEPLKKMASQTATYLDEVDDPHEGAGAFSLIGADGDGVRSTLQVLGEAEGIESLRDQLCAVRWQGDSAAAAERDIALEDGQIRLTRYLVISVPGSTVRTDRFDTPLYAVPDDEQGLTEDEAEARRDELSRFRYSRREVLDGAFSEGGARPLVWLERHQVHDALLQGTVAVRLPDGSTRMFNVHRSNDRAWVPTQRDPEKQERFWYFREVDGVMGWGADRRIPLVPKVAVAGDVRNLGLGTLFLLQDPDGELRLAILGDTGGAFEPNLFQLDWLAGTFPDRAALDAATADLSGRVTAYALFPKDSAACQAD